MAKYRDCKLGCFLVVGFTTAGDGAQLAHVAAEVGEAKQAALLAEGVLELIGA